MASVVIIHAAEDTLPARALAEKLRQAQLSVMIEKQGDELREAVRGAAVTVALWSPRSNAQPALIDEVAAARAKSAVVHASMQSAPAPEEFRSEPVVNLTGWRGEDDFPAWRELAKLVTSKAGVAPLPPPAPRPASGFFQPGRPSEAAQAPAPRSPAPPQQRASAASAPRTQPQAAPSGAPPRSAPADDAAQKGGKGLAIAAAAIVALAVIGGGAFYFLNQQGGQGAAAWEQVDRNDPDALRAFIDTATGDARSQAQAVLRTLENNAYQEARAANSIEALQAFLADFPDSQHAIAARGRIAELESLPPTPVEGELPPGELAPADPGLATTDPDLLPPGATTPEPAPGSAPVPLTPPPAESEPLPEPGAETPTN